jgi:hypothetical protein
VQVFGYVQVYKPELKVCEYDTYRAIYCSLCKCLGREYGLFSKLILSYDFTFLAVLKLALGEKNCEFEKGKCALHPTKPCPKLKGEYEALSFASACALIMVKYKLKDNLSDKGLKSKIKSAFAYPFLFRAFKKAEKKYPDVAAAVREMTEKQGEIEKQNCDSFDRAAEPTASLLSFIFAQGESDEVKIRILNRIGYCIGKWIYLCDALDDAADDLKKGNYNPIIAKGEGSKEAVIPLIRACSAEAAASYELLDISRYGGILENIIYLGMPQTVKFLSNTLEEDNEKSV